MNFKVLFTAFGWILITVCCINAQNKPTAADGQGGGSFQAQGNLPAANLEPAKSSEGKVPTPDAGGDGITWDGKSFKISDLRAVDSKFSAYLNEPEISFAEEKEYAELVEKITDLLDVYRIRGRNREYLIQEVMPLLRKASRHPRDGGLCRSIYNAVGTDLQAKDASDSKKERMRELEKKVDSIKWNMKMAAQSGTLAPNGSKAAQDDEVSRNVKYTFLNDELQNTYAEMQALAKQDLEKMGDSRIALQRVVVGLFLARRFDHVMIGSSIYRLMYSDGAGEVKLQQRLIQEAAENAKQLRAAANVATSESTKTVRASNYKEDQKTSTRAESGITSMLPGTTAMMDSMTGAKLQIAAAIPDTMTEVEMISQEAIDQCNRYLTAVKGHMAQNELDNALQRLQEAFAAGEHLACVRSFPRDMKQTLWKYKNAVKEARVGLASKDLGKAKEAITKINQLTSDNPLSKEGSEIGNVETISAMHLAKAKEAASRGDREAMNKELEEAAKAWPQNPSLASATSKIIEQLDQQSQNKNELRKLIQQKNYKYIFEEKARFLACAADDEKLLADLNQVLENQGSSLAYVAKAEELLKRSDPFGAWESADEGVKKNPENTDLLRIRSDAAMMIPEFVKEIEKGRAAEGRQDPVTALCAFLAARRIYPNSVLAKEGIDKNTKQTFSF